MSETTPDHRPLTDLIGLAPHLTGDLEPSEYVQRQYCDHGPQLDAHAAEVDALRQRHHREIGAHLAGQHDHADDCAGCSIRADDREVIRQLRGELEEARAALTELAPASLGAELERTRADLAAARAKLDAATKGGTEWWSVRHRTGRIQPLTGARGNGARDEAYRIAAEDPDMVVVHRIVPPWRDAPAAGDTAGQDGASNRYMMATKATHKLGDISRDEPDLAIIYGEAGEDYIGEWVTGVGFVNVRFPKATTRSLNAKEIAYYRTKVIDTAGSITPIVIDDAQAGQDAAGGEGRE